MAKAKQPVPNNTTSVTPAETLLLEILGLRFLAFVLNADETEVDNRLQGKVAFTPQQESALGELVTFLGTIPHGQDAQHPFSISLSLGVLGQFQPALGRSWATANRVAAGGAIDVPATNDALSTALLEITKDVYPLCLLPSGDDHYGFMTGPPLTSAVFRHPQNDVFEKAVMKDGTLKQLFPDDTETSGQHGSVYRSTGSGGGVQLSMFAEGLIKNAWQVARQSDPNPNLQALADCVLEQLRLIRLAIQGKKLSIRALVGITGLRLPAGGVLTLPWGRLREVTESDRQMIPPGLSGKLSTTTESGQNIVIDYAGDLVMEMEVPYSIKIGSADIAGGWPTKLTSAEALEQRLETLRLALLLSTNRHSAPIALGTWNVYFDPLAIGGKSTSWRDPRKGRSLAPVALTKKEASKWEEWVKLVDERRVKNIDVAIRRTLIAAAERPDPTDALVDAVIAWENLVGSSQGESTLRIAAALAWLLGKNAQQRHDIRKQVADLYKVRSDVVHGNRFLKPKESSERHQEALDIAVRSLRAIFREQPHLLSDCADSTARSLRLVLNEPPPAAIAGK